MLLLYIMYNNVNIIYVYILYIIIYIIYYVYYILLYTKYISHLDYLDWDPVGSICDYQTIERRVHDIPKLWAIVLKPDINGQFGDHRVR